MTLIPKDMTPVYKATIVKGTNATWSDIDQGMKLGCNHPIGTLADMIGLDVLLSVMQILHDELADSKYRSCPLLKELVAAGHLGRKSGRGVYLFGRPTQNPSLGAAAHQHAWLWGATA